MGGSVFEIWKSRLRRTDPPSSTFLDLVSARSSSGTPCVSWIHPCTEFATGVKYVFVRLYFRDLENRSRFNIFSASRRSVSVKFVYDQNYSNVQQISGMGLETNHCLTNCMRINCHPPSCFTELFCLKVKELS